MQSINQPSPWHLWACRRSLTCLTGLIQSINQSSPIHLLPVGLEAHVDLLMQLGQHSLIGHGTPCRLHLNVNKIKNLSATHKRVIGTLLHTSIERGWGGYRSGWIHVIFLTWILKIWKIRLTLVARKFPNLDSPSSDPVQQLWWDLALDNINQVPHRSRHIRLPAQIKNMNL